MFDGALTEALRVGFLLSVVPLSGAVIIGFLVSFIQSATQIQEQSIGFLIKLSVLGCLIFFGGDMAIRILCAMTQDFILSASIIGRS